MPIFILKCSECGMIFDFYKLKDADKPLCPQCANEEKFEKLPTAATLNFKGEGWSTPNYTAMVDPTTVPGVKKIEPDKQTLEQKTLYKTRKEVTGRRKKIKIAGMREKRRRFALGKE